MALQGKLVGSGCKAWNRRQRDDVMRREHEKVRRLKKRSRQINRRKAITVTP
jgi:hypothetical protein